MPMKLLLREDVRTLGQTGDVVTVADGYGRNYLLPKGLAVEVTPANLQRIEAERKLRLAREAERVSDLKAIAERIQAIDITLRERVAAGETLYGSVSPREIAAALADEGIGIEPEMVRLEEPIKTLGVHRVRIHLHPEVDAELKLWVVEIKESEEAPSA
jgi:large subunit ribosomal protein L9